MSRFTFFLVACALFLGGTYLYSTREDGDNSFPVPVILSAHDLSMKNLPALFAQWTKTYNKVYAHDVERSHRFLTFSRSVQEILAHTNPSYQLGLTAYADMTSEEFMDYFHLGKPAVEEDCSATVPTAKLGFASVHLPEEIDWRKLGAVGPVKNQGHCGSCWTFSSTGALESHLLLRTKKFTSLSEQELLDCAGNYDNHGCNGGLPSHAFQYIVENGGLSTERAYPYQGVDNLGCRVKDKRASKMFRPSVVGIKLRSVFNITQFDEHELEVAVGSVGPVSVAFEVSGDFRLYKSGVYSSKECKNHPKDVNHAVLAVGYGTDLDSGKKYWIIKNSWGPDWGESGYFKMERGVNMCGVAVCASFPILE